MTTRTLPLLTALVWATCVVHAQQVQQFTQFQHLGLAYNPAFAGSDAYFSGFAVHRTQWAGINDAPRTYMMGLHAPSASGKMGFGGTLYTDVTGPTRRTGINGTYAYHVQLSEGTKLAFGATGGITQYSLDGTQIRLREEGDMALLPIMMSEIKPDAAFGALWYGERFHVGISANQLIPNRLEFFPGDGDGTTVMHYFFSGAYRFDASDAFSIEPAVLVKYAGPLAPQADISTRAIYKGNLWLGGSYRTNAAAAVFAGYRVLDYLSIGYSMDFATTDIRNYSDGSHEIVLALRFVRKQLVAPKTE